VPDLPGLYRVRRVGRTELDYVGQTGLGKMTLRRRLGMFRGVFTAEMPYRDPHTAAPALWALRHVGAGAFEVSVAPVAGPTPWRKGLEALTIARHRQEFGRSPAVQFGRMPLGYQASTGNDARLVAEGKRQRGGPSGAMKPCHLSGTPPSGPLGGEPEALGWGGHTWSSWRPMAEAGIVRDASGIYRIRGQSGDGLLYIGEGRIGARLRAHLAKTRRLGDRQGGVFSAAPSLETSWVAGGWAAHQRLELEVDLIASHLLVTGRVPRAQFLG
jgi:hypothetical protein